MHKNEIAREELQDSLKPRKEEEEHLITGIAQGKIDSYDKVFMKRKRPEITDPENARRNVPISERELDYRVAFKTKKGALKSYRRWLDQVLPGISTILAVFAATTEMIFGTRVAELVSHYFN
ncbi:MAG TPA: hypothetical protein VLB27_02430 [candidate division Zixibacteria bacterium]|nr:hypothetical protein [candidate division Zixibacteria bacterium]